MNKLAILLKYQLISIFNKFKYVLLKKKKSKSISMILSFALISLAIYAFIIVYIFMFIMLFNEGGVPEGGLYIVVVAITMISLMSSITKSNSYLFRMYDYDILFPLPIDNKTIVSSKIMSLLFESIGLSIIIGVPTLIIYSLLVPLVWYAWIMGLIVIICIPLFPIVVGSVISFVFGFIPLNSRVKNILSAVVYISFFSVFMFGYMNIQGAGEDVALQTQMMFDSIKNLYFLGFTVVSGMTGNINNFLLFVGISLFSALIFIVMVSLFFKKMTVIANNITPVKKAKVKEEDFKGSSKLKALIKKELLIYINTPSYILNTIIGPLMSMIITISFGSKIKDFVIGEIEGVAIEQTLFVFIYIIMMIFFFTLVSTSSSSLSLEGKSFWIIKTSPLQYKPLFISKMFINFIISIPFLIADTVIFIVLMSLPIYMYIAIFLVPLLFIIGTTMIGLYFNICYPKFDYDNPQKVVKNSIPVLLTMLLSFAAIIISFIVAIVGYMVFGDIITVVILCVIGVLYCLLSYGLLYTKGVKKYYSLEY